MSDSCYIGSSSTGAAHIISTSSSSAVYVPVVKNARKETAKSLRQKRKEHQRLENGIYSHIQAIRALGRNTTTTYEISKALDIPYWKVEAAIKRLQDKGVKINRVC